MVQDPSSNAKAFMRLSKGEAMEDIKLCIKH